MATLVIDGTPREIRLDWRALRAAEGLMTRAVTEVLGHHGGLFKQDELVALCWGAWAQRDRRLTVRAAQESLERYLDAGGTMGEIQAAVTEAVIESGLLLKRDEVPAGDNGIHPTSLAPPGAASPS
jgi:hypothetical protein